MRKFPPPAVVREIVSNRYFLGRVYRSAGALDLEAVLEVTDESFQAYDALRNEHGDKATSEAADRVDEDEDNDEDEDEEEEDIPDFDQQAAKGRGPDDDDDDDDDDEDEDGAEHDDDALVDQRLTIPLYLPRGFIWEIEHFDNGEDSGIVHRIRAPGEEPVRFATLDAHPTGHFCLWADAERLFRAADADPRNRAGNVAAVAPLLLWSAIGLTETDDREAVRARLAEAWRHTGVSPEVADQLALESSRRRASSLPQGAPLDAFQQLLAALG